MKFYYNGQLVRTSKTHEYKYAVINTETGKAYACSKDMKGIDKAMSEIRRPLNHYQSLKNGTYRRKDRWSYTLKQATEKAIEMYGSIENAIAECEANVARYKIVELEAR